MVAPGATSDGLGWPADVSLSCIGFSCGLEVLIYFAGSQVARLGGLARWIHPKLEAKRDFGFAVYIANNQH